MNGNPDYTLLDDPNLKSVQFYVEGAPTDAPDGENHYLPGPFTKDNYLNY